MKLELKIRYGDCGAGNEDVSSDIYLSLGLKGVGFSRVLSHLSSLLKRSVQRNETQIEAKHVKGQIDFKRASAFDNKHYGCSEVYG